MIELSDDFIKQIDKTCHLYNEAESLLHSAIEQDDDDMIKKSLNLYMKALYEHEMLLETL